MPRRPSQLLMRGTTWQQFERRAIGRVELMKQYLALDLFTRFVAMTPRKTGRAQASWNIAVGTEPDRTVPPPGNYGAPRPSLSGPVPIGQTVWVTSNLNYMQFLEQGSSTQAPYGIVDVSILAVLDNLESHAAVLRSGGLDVGLR